ncbi:signal peptide-containing protein [Theileria equi strain WA]|uniref:Signal peptide-containing protein n=1 Tax=Theileria equi strain WA TaxID=1537102 RepID=L0AX49_THEEQ|nr:signal peptide-containing protein [Theileria equi strain WA]AFZ79459.1 signal peptide-containing protein [Theileria equi strain WA]|eukprot:XP_004829125.1 signal peptide-containing protein [Theileria equi strain WA]
MNSVVFLQGLFLFIILSFKYADTVPGDIKDPIELDLSDELPDKVKIIPSVKFSGGSNYLVMKKHRSTHTIGAVVDKENLLVNSSEENMGRYVLVVPIGDGSRYVRVVTRSRTGSNYFTAVDEFIKGPSNFGYSRVSRISLDLDILTQQSSNLISIDVFPDPYSPQSVTAKFTVNKEMMHQAVIGRVKYGKYVVNDGVEGLIERSVTWEGGPDDPRITILSLYKDGMYYEIRYVFETEPDEGFHNYSDKIRLIHSYE